MNEHLIQQFYQSFQQKDFKTMQSLYSEKAIFSDPVFQNLNANQVRAMWEMLILKSTDLTISYNEIKADERSGSAKWKAIYTFNNNKVINNISAKFQFENGKIAKHTDDFDFYKWTRQALGVKGVLLGWSSFIQKEVQNMASRNLSKFIDSKVSND